jgi:hypothetical protein
VGIVREVMTWPDYSLDQLALHGIPVERAFVPLPHSSRKGWVAKDVCFPENPFTCDVDSARWRMRTGARLSLRDMAGRTTRVFWDSIRALGDPLSLRLIGAVMRGGASSLLELPERPAAYDDVGRLCGWNDLFPVGRLPRSRYERVLGHAISGRRVRVGGSWHRPVGVRGWTHVVFRRERDGARQVRSLDDMLQHLDAWDRSAERRLGDRRRSATGEGLERRLRDRRTPVEDTLQRRREGDLPVDSLEEGAYGPQTAGPEADSTGVAAGDGKGAGQASASGGPEAPGPAAPGPRSRAAARNDAPLIIVSRTS